MEYYFLSDKGKIREKNQDNCRVIEDLNHDLLALVCDGIGGNKAGEIASYEVVNYFEKLFGAKEGFKDLDELKSFMEYHIRQASHLLYELSYQNPDYEGMGTTITGVALTSVGKIVFNAGDSRVYGFKDQKLYPLTFDHTYVNELVQRHMITPYEAKIHPKKHYLTRFLGVYDDGYADIKEIDDDYESYLLSSDGLHGYVRQADIEAVLNQDASLSLKCKQLIDLALKEGGYDNITVVLLKGEDHGK